MDENRFTMAAWSSIAAAVLLPVAFIVAGLESVPFKLDFVDHAVGIGIADFLFLILGVFLIHVLLNLKRYMYERYSYKSLDQIIVIAIIWTIVNYGGSLVLEILFLISQLQ